MNKKPKAKKKIYANKEWTRETFFEMGEDESHREAPDVKF